MFLGAMRLQLHAGLCGILLWKRKQVKEGKETGKRGRSKEKMGWEWEWESRKGQGGRKQDWAEKKLEPWHCLSNRLIPYIREGAGSLHCMLYRLTWLTVYTCKLYAILCISRHYAKLMLFSILYRFYDICIYQCTIYLYIHHLILYIYTHTHYT